MARGIIAEFINGPWEGRTQLVSSYGSREIVIDVVEPTTFTPVAVSPNSPLPNFKEAFTRYTYVPVSQYMSRDGMTVYRYVCKQFPLPKSTLTLEKVYETVRMLYNVIEVEDEEMKVEANKRARQHAKKRKYKVTRRPKMMEANNGKA